MTLREMLGRLTQQPGLNFLLTNRIPRTFLTRVMGRLSRSEHPWVCRGGIALWRLFSDLDLSEAKQTSFKSMHACFTRELKEGARPLDGQPTNLVSPCDALVGACGRISAGSILQAKDSAYPLAELIADPAAALEYEDGHYVTLRLTSAMYHRFHAPADCTVERVTYICGDTWNVNSAALQRVAKLFCKNERAVIRCRLAGSGVMLTLVPVAAILVASIRLRFLDLLLHLKYSGPEVIDCSARLARGEEMGWFEHGSTIIVLAPAGLKLAPAVRQGAHLRMGEALFRPA